MKFLVSQFYIWTHVLIFLGLLFGARLFFLSNFDSAAADLPGWSLAIWKGVLWDLKLSAVLLVPFFLSSFLFFAPMKNRFFKIWKKTFFYYFLISITFVAIAAICNHFYFATYGNYIDLFAFDFFKDETSAVARVIWNDYPVLGALFGYFIFIYLMIRLSQLIRSFTDSLEKKSFRVFRLTSSRYGVPVALLFLSMEFLSIRGSVGVFPLSRKWSTISDRHTLNSAVPNGMIAFYWSIVDLVNVREIPKVHIGELNDVLDFLYPEASSQEKGVYSKPLSRVLKITPKDMKLEKRPPNVVFALMEGMSGHFLEFHDSKKNNLLGDLEPHFQSDFVWQRFLSGDNGTFSSLMKLLLATQNLDLPTSEYRKVSFFSSVARPYKSKGYETIFLTSGTSGWRGLNSFLLENSFDRVIGAETIEEAFPEAVLQDWGVPDEYTFQFASKLLKERRTKKPLMIFILTISCHPPYVVPEHYRAHPINIDESMIDFFDLENGTLNQIAISYQYGNDSLGKFIGAIKSSTEGAKTIIAASGDHNIRQLNYEGLENLARQRAVPFYLFVPKDYRKGTFLKDQLGSHKDIFPTLFHLSLSEAEYLRTGENLLGKGLDSTHFAYNENLMGVHSGVVDLRSEGGLARWIESEPLLLSNVRDSIESGIHHRRRAQAYRELLDWLTAWQVYGGTFKTEANGFEPKKNF